jgi:hypothetical protein
MRPVRDTTFSYEELDRLSGELLPSRTLMSVVPLSYGLSYPRWHGHAHAPGHRFTSPQAHGYPQGHGAANPQGRAPAYPQGPGPTSSQGDGHHGIVTEYACQVTSSSGTPGLLGTGLLAQPSYSSMVCVPAVVHQY